jgi:spermidine synthase
LTPDTPRLHSNKQTISLSFESTLIQSCMLLEAPDELVLDYTRTMMGFVLFNPAPMHVLMIGLGGGSMLKYMHSNLPMADITTVEISQGVIDMRHEFLIPPDDARHRIVCADGAAFLRKPPNTYDLILVDGFDGQGLPEALCSRSFYKHCREALTPGGLLVANVQADTTQTREILQRLGKAFSSAMITVESDEGGNEIAVAANSMRTLQDCQQSFDARWAALAPAHQSTLAVSSLRFQRALNKNIRPACES